MKHLGNSLLFSVCLCVSVVKISVGLELRPASTLVVQSGDSTPVAFLVVNTDRQRHHETVVLTGEGATVRPDSFTVELPPGGWKVLAAQVSLRDDVDSGQLTGRIGTSRTQITVVRGLDLTTQDWKRSPTVYESLPDPLLAAPDLDDRRWLPLRIPALWNELGHTVCRLRVPIPEAWRGRHVRLRMGAIDDNDVAYLNGEEIGRTIGWDRPREYVLPERLIRWGQENVLTVVVDNINAGGGPYKPPFLLIAGEAALPTAPLATAPSAVRPPAGAIGKPLPLRSFHVDRGVLRYPNGAEVALWGVNYYPQSWYQFENMRKLGVDMKAIMRQDFDHMQQMGVEVIRIHVFDREISDGDGNIIPNVHIDLLDYLVAECNRRGIYLYFTPIAWWGGPNERKGAFSGETSKPGMTFVPQARAAAARYLRQFLTRVNRYTGRAYKDEPCLCLLEVQNEPAYFLYGDLYANAYPPQGERPDVLERDHRLFREQWRAWLAANELEDAPVFFPLFRYEMMRRYITEMVAAIRSTGAKQPIAISYFGVNGEDITQAIADSECEAITVSAYPGGWAKVNDGTNLLPQAAPLSLDARLAGKARLAYEFDTPATNTSSYLFPALAAHFRSGEVQVACQFQYDSISTARWNTDWHAHWLNWLYTPSKTASFIVGREAFHRLPRGVRYPAPTTELKLGPMATSFSHNLSLLVTPDTVVYSRTVRDWKPLPFPAAPKRVVGVGSSLYVEYGGTGLYILERVGANTLRLTINPDARLIGNSLQSDLNAPAAELEVHTHLFRLRLSGWEKARCFPAGRRQTQPMPAAQGGWLLRPGVYEIRRR